jgi:large subunit ribosomal protein L23
MKSPYEIIKGLLRTEKESELLLPLNKYLFLVDIKADKIQIKKAIEDIYNVKVDCVNTHISSGKKRRLRYQEGMTPDRKKAIVTLKEGYKIDMA